MTERSLYLAAYDVAEERRLRTALAVVKTFATGGQKSVYEIFLTTTEKAQLLRTMTLVLHPEDDRFFLLRLDPRSTVHALGTAVAPADPPFFYAG